MTTTTQTTPSDIAIEFDDVVAGYGEFMILNRLSLQARRGKITLLLGPNGAGKSTVLKTLFGLLKVRQGRIRLEGRDITGASAKSLLVEHGVAFVPQGRNLFGQLSVWENLELGGITLGMLSTSISSECKGRSAVPQGGHKCRRLGSLSCSSRPS